MDPTRDLTTATNDELYTMAMLLMLRLRADLERANQLPYAALVDDALDDLCCGPWESCEPAISDEHLPPGPTRPALGRVLDRLLETGTGPRAEESVISAQYLLMRSIPPTG